MGDPHPISREPSMGFWSGSALGCCACASCRPRRLIRSIQRFGSGSLRTASYWSRRARLIISAKEAGHTGASPVAGSLVMSEGVRNDVLRSSVQIEATGLQRLSMAAPVEPGNEDDGSEQDDTHEEAGEEYGKRVHEGIARFPGTRIDQMGSAKLHIILGLSEIELPSLSFMSSQISSTDAQCSIQRSQ